MRTLSWLFGLLAYLGVPLWANYEILAYDQAMGGHGCGNVVLAIEFDALMSAGVFSALAGGLGLAAFWRLTKPASKWRNLEIFCHFFPAIIAAICSLFLVVF